MANRYWVGGTGSWSSLDPTKWAATSGGAGGASTPTVVDDVFFDSASGTAAVTISTGAVAKSINCTGFTGNITGSTAMTIAGSLTLATTHTMNYTGIITFSGVGTLTTVGKALACAINVNGANAQLTLGDALTTSNTITVNFGTFDSASYNILASNFNTGSTSAKIINLGSSTVTVSSNINFSNTGLVLDAGTSLINLTGTGSAITGSTLPSQPTVFYNVQFSNSTVNTTKSVYGFNTFNRLILAAPGSVAGYTNLKIGNNQTINDQIYQVSTFGNRRVKISSVYPGSAQRLIINNNSPLSLLNVDFQDIYVEGNAAPISGTNFGDHGNCRGITFSTPRTLYWRKTTSGNIHDDDAWSVTPDYALSSYAFPLAQDTAVIDNQLASGSTITMNATMPILGSVDFSSRNVAMNFTLGANIILYGNLKLSNSVVLPATYSITFSGDKTKTITSNGRFLPMSVIVDSCNGSVELDGALTLMNSSVLALVQGTFDTKGYAVSVAQFNSNATYGSYIRKAYFRDSTISFSGTLSTCFSLNSVPGLTIDAGTSTIAIASNTMTSIGTPYRNQRYYNVLYMGNTSSMLSGTFNNVTFTRPSSNVTPCVCSMTSGYSLVVEGTMQFNTPLNVLRRIILLSGGYTTTVQSTIQVNSVDNLNAVDFRCINVTGNADFSNGTSIGDYGFNSGITFTAPKSSYAVTTLSTPYGNMWASTSGGTADLANFPLPQDTMVFDNNYPQSLITFGVGNLNMFGSIDATNRTNVLTISPQTSFSAVIVGKMKLSSAVTLNQSSGTGIELQAVNSDPSFFANGATINTALSLTNVKLGSSLTLASTRTLTIRTLTNSTLPFDSNGYTVTAGLFYLAGGEIYMRNSSWFATGTGTIWDGLPNSVDLNCGTSIITLSNSTTSARTFAGFGKTYYELNIGGDTATSTTTITGNNEILRLSSSKTVAHTIALIGSNVQTIGEWLVTGTAGNVVSVTSGNTNHTISGGRVTGVNYLAMNTTGFATTSLGEFYAGPNSTGTNATIIKSNAPTSVTRYWVGGTGTWTNTSTTNWSATSGGPGGASVPTSADDVIFDSASSATAYTVTCTASMLRCKSLTMSAAANGGNLTWAGTAPIAIHGSVNLSGVTHSHTGAKYFTGPSGSINTFTPNGVSFTNLSANFSGPFCTWELGSAVLGSGTTILQIIRGIFNTNGYTVSTSDFSVNPKTPVSVNFGSSQLTAGIFSLSTSRAARTLIDFNCGTSAINMNINNPIFYGNNKVFNTVSFTNASAGTITYFAGANTYSTFNITAPGTNVRMIQFAENQTIGTLNIIASAPAEAYRRVFIRSVTTGVPVTINCTQANLVNTDLADINFVGPAVPVSGIRLGDCKGNTNVVFDAPKTVYLVTIASSPTQWNTANSWSFTSNGVFDTTAFPLAQDTAVIDNNSSQNSSELRIIGNYQIGTIDMTSRTNLLLVRSQSPDIRIYGDVLGSSQTPFYNASTGNIIFSGRKLQIYSTGNESHPTYPETQFGPNLIIDSKGGTVKIVGNKASAFSNGTVTIVEGELDLNGYSLQMNKLGFSTNSNLKKLSFNGGILKLIGVSTVINNAAENNFVTIDGPGTLKLEGAGTKTVTTNNLIFNSVTLDIANSGALTISGNNTFGDITNSYKSVGAVELSLGSTTQTLTNFSASGGLNKLLTITGATASSGASLVITGTTNPNSKYLQLALVNIYTIAPTVAYANTNSVQLGAASGWYFIADPAVPSLFSNVFYSGTNITSLYYGSTPVLEVYYGSTKVWG